MTQRQLRSKCIDYMCKHGTTQAFFCRKLKISAAHMSLWLVGERDMSQQRLDMLNEILDR